MFRSRNFQNLEIGSFYIVKAAYMHVVGIAARMLTSHGIRSQWFSGQKGEHAVYTCRIWKCAPTCRACLLSLSRRLQDSATSLERLRDNDIFNLWLCVAL
jgi:hypothetical protein